MKRNKLLSTYIIVGSCLFLIIVHILFKMEAPVKWLEAVWGAGDLISFVGTIALGVIAITQANDANETNERLLAIEEDRRKLETRPFVILENWGGKLCTLQEIINSTDGVYAGIANTNKSDHLLCIRMNFLNTTESFCSVTLCHIENPKKQNDRPLLFSYVETTNKKIRLRPNESGLFVLYGDNEQMKETFGKNPVRIRLTLENRFGEPYCEEFDCSFTMTNLLCSSAPLHIIAHATNYRIGKYQTENKDIKPTDKIIWEEDTPKHPFFYS